MPLLHVAYVIARRRIVSSWRLELALFLGIVLAVALLSSGVVFSDLLAEAALRRTLTQATTEEANFLVRAFNDLDDPRLSGRRPVYQRGVDLVEERVAARLRPYLDGQARLLETAPVFFEGHPQLELANGVRPRGKIQFMTDLQDPKVTKLEQGVWPAWNLSREPAPSSEPLQVAVDVEGAELLQLGVDDQMRVFPASGWEEPVSIPVRIVGIFSRLDPDDQIWYGRERDFSSKNDRRSLVPLFTTEDGILRGVGRAYPGINTNVTWMFKLDRQGVGAQEVNALRDTIRLVRHDVASQLDNGSTAIKLDRVLERHSEQLLLARVPLFLMVFLVTGILAYYLALVAGLMVRSRNAELSMLKSRGATTFQIGLLVLVEGLLLAIPAIILGTLLAPVLGRVLGGLFFDAPGGPVPVVLSPLAFLLGAAGALLAVTVLTVSTLVAARQGIVEFRQSGARPPRAPLIHRYYIDILLLVLIGLIWLQIQTRGDFLVQPLGSGELEMDFTLLLGPVLGLLAIGLLVLRFFPLAVVLVARLAEPVGPAWLVQGLRRVSRDPILPGSLVVLLMLSTSLGVIGSGFSSTLDRSQRDQARYQAGADLRIQHNGDGSPTTLLGLSGLAQELDSVEHAAEVRRLNGHLLTQGFSTTSVNILAVDTRNFAPVAWYRPDFAAGSSLPELIQTITPNLEDGSGANSSAHGIPLPPEAGGLAVWALVDRPDSRLSLQARIRDASDRYFDIALGDLDSPGWQRLESELSPPPQGIRAPRASVPIEPTPPFTLVSLQSSSIFGINQPGVVFLDQVIAVTPSGDQVIADSQALGGWQVVEDHARPGLYALEASPSVRREGSGQSAAFSWAPGGVGVRAIRPGTTEEPIPVVASPAVLKTARARVGDVLALGISTYSLPVRIVAVAEYFPTLDPRKQAFMVLDLETFIRYSNLHNRRVVGGPNELWVRLNQTQSDPSSIRGALDDRGISVRDTYLSSELVTQRVEQPLANAGWEGLLVIMFLALVLASASGMVLFSYLDTRERQTEFALLRTLGSTTRQLNGVVWFSLLLVVVGGIGLGTWAGHPLAGGIGLGTWAGQQIEISLLPILEVAEGGVRVTPPMVFQTNWLTLLASYLVLAAVAGGTAIWLAWLTAKLEVQQVLRAGEAGG